jgi:hypothetical protein
MNKPAEESQKNPPPTKLPRMVIVLDPVVFSMILLAIS